jgi:hypothetical protein
MAEKPRVKAPKQRASTSHDPGRNRRLLGIGAAAAGGLLGVVAVVAFLGLGGAGTPSADDAREALAAANCTLQVEPAVTNVSNHSDFPDPEGTSDAWNTDPPTSGPHYGITLIFGAYDEPVDLGRVLHNLEHGAVYILYGDDVPESTVTELRAFYDDHQNGTILAPYPEMGDQIALGAWLVDGLPEASNDRGSGVLAKCTSFDQDAFDAFFDAFQFKGPESFDPSQLQPGL